MCEPLEFDFIASEILALRWLPEFSPRTLLSSVHLSNPRTITPYSPDEHQPMYGSLVHETRIHARFVAPVVRAQYNVLTVLSRTKSQRDKGHGDVVYSTRYWQCRNALRLKIVAPAPTLPVWVGRSLRSSQRDANPSSSPCWNRPFSCLPGDELPGGDRPGFIRLDDGPIPRSYTTFRMKLKTKGATYIRHGG